MGIKFIVERQTVEGEFISKAYGIVNQDFNLSFYRNEWKYCDDAGTLHL